MQRVIELEEAVLAPARSAEHLEVEIESADSRVIVAEPVPLRVAGIAEPVGLGVFAPASGDVQTSVIWPNPSPDVGEAAVAQFASSW